MLAWATGLSLDAKLAWRMLRKSPALTVIGVLGISLGAAVGVAAFVVLAAHFFPSIPLHEGDRLVALENWNVENSRPAPRSLHDFITWRDEMRSVQPIAAAAYMGERVFVTGNAVPEEVMGAAMTAAGFQIARVRALLGRYFTPDDERENAPRVAVIGYDLWMTRFDGEPSVIGRRILVDGVAHDVVGVMPPGFAFPKSQSLWTTLPLSPALYPRGQGPPLFVFGRLAAGVTRDQAQAELTAIGARSATSFPGTNARLRPQLLPYTYPLNNTRALQLAEVATMQLVVNLLLIAIAVNVAMLVYARTAVRQREIAIRTALGASRRRIVGQLFIEALLLSTLGAVLGLFVAHAAVRELLRAFEPIGGRPFWLDLGLQPRSVAFALAVAIVAAVIIGVVPGLKATGRGINASLQLFRSGGGLHLGRTWTMLIVAQVAVVVTVLPTALNLGYEEIAMRHERANFPANEVVTARLGLAVAIEPGIDGAAYQRETAARFATELPELERALEADPAIDGVVLEGPAGDGSIEIEPAAGSGTSVFHEDLNTRGIAPDYFDVLGVPLLAGRALDAADAAATDGGLIVSEGFVRTVLNGEPAIGRRIRFVGRSGDGGRRPAGPWREIVGVVENPYASPLDPRRARSIVYHGVVPTGLQAASLLIRVRGGDANGVIPRIQQIIANGNPDFRLGRISSLSATPNARYLTVVMTGGVLALLTVLLLSAVGIHALMSLTVTRRRKEIGIRIALGASRGRLLTSIFSRAAWQLALGGSVGALLGALLLRFTGHAGFRTPLLLGGVVALMLVAGLLATARPARVGAAIQPMEALRAEDV